MKRNLFRISCCLSAVLLFVACGRTPKAPELKDRTDSLSWAYGQNIADALHQGYFNELDPDLILQSAQYTLAGGKEQPMSPEAIKEALDYILMQYSISMRESAHETQNAVDAQQEAYFAKLVKENPNVKRHPQGFYYEVLREGKGPKAIYAQRIRFDYRSYLMLTGEPFDQTYGQRDPIIHVVGQPMFPGLIEAFQLMNAGSIYRFYFPYQLAFGASGSGDIPGYTPFIYEIELHELYNN